MVKDSVMIRGISLLTFLATAALAFAPARADNVVYQFPALHGGANTCQWFDDNLNDRSEAALVRQIDAIYNRVALPPGAPVTIAGKATTSSGTQILAFNLNRMGLCAQADAIEPPAAPAPAPT